MATDFAGKTALITGAGRGIGRAIALKLGGRRSRADPGRPLRGRLAQTQDSLRQRGHPTRQVGSFPLTSATNNSATARPQRHLRQAAWTSWSTTRPPSSRSAPTAAIQAAGLRRAFELNVIARARCTAGMLPGMLNAQAGAALSTSPAGSSRGPDSMVRFNAYAATKAALEAHTVNLAAELGGTGVTVNVYRPGAVESASCRPGSAGEIPGRIGTAAYERLNRNFAEGTLIAREQSAAALIAHLVREDHRGHLGRQHRPRRRLMPRRDRRRTPQGQCCQDSS